MTERSQTDKLLVMVLVHLMGDASQKDKAVALDKAGLSPTEIAEILDTSAPTVSQQLYEARKQTRASPKRQKRNGDERTKAK